MGKRTSIKPSTRDDSKQSSSTKTEETSVQKHAKFWDKTNKGYITPLDTISGFITLGYSVVFSVALGAFVGVFLSISTQTGWFPDPLCRSNVRNMIRAKQRTLNNSGAYDADGVFNPEKFEALFNKYAKSDKSGETITMAELIRMTQEQERLSKNVKAWATSLVELCTAYFFVGHHGSIRKEDVCSVYDGTLFYRLKDNHKLMIQGKKQGDSLKGSYLSKPPSPLSPKAMEHRVHLIFSALKSKTSIAAEYGLHDLASYIQDKTNEIKDKTLPRALRRPTSIIQGVGSPKASMFKSINKKAHDDPSQLFPDGLTGVAKATSEAALMGTEFLSSLLRHGTEPASKTRGMHGIFEDNSLNDTMEKDTTIFRNLTKSDDTQEVSKPSVSNPAAAGSSMADFPPLPSQTFAAVADSSNDSPVNGFLRSNEKEASNEWHAAGLTGVVQQQTNNEPESTVSTESIKKVSNIPVKQSKTHDYSNAHQTTVDEYQHETVPKASITPPPEEKIDAVMDKQTPPEAKKTVPAVSHLPVNNKKNKRKNKKNKSGQISPNSGSDSGHLSQESSKAIAATVS